MATYSEATSGDRLSFTLFLAAAVHAMLIFGISFTLDRGQKVAPTLNITLSTHRDTVAPDKADFLAQHNQQGSGTGAEIKELTTIAPSEIADTNIREINPIAQQKAMTQSRSATQLLASTHAQERKVAQQTDPDRDVHSEEKTGETFDAPLANPELASLQAQLDKLKQAEARKPRVRRLISVATKSSHDAAYLNKWQQDIIQVGNSNFPEEALDKAIFGYLRMAVLVNRDGTVENIEILQSSGHRILDDAAQQIVRLAAPFSRFPPEIQKNADQLEIIRTWKFEITGLSTTQ